MAATATGRPRAAATVPAIVALLGAGPRTVFNGHETSDGGFASYSHQMTAWFATFVPLPEDAPPPRTTQHILSNEQCLVCLAGHAAPGAAPGAAPLSIGSILLRNPVVDKSAHIDNHQARMRLLAVHRAVTDLARTCSCLSLPQYFAQRFTEQFISWLMPMYLFPPQPPPGRAGLSQGDFLAKQLQLCPEWTVGRGRHAEWLAETKLLVVVIHIAQALGLFEAATGFRYTDVHNGNIRYDVAPAAKRDAGTKPWAPIPVLRCDREDATGKKTPVTLTRLPGLQTRGAIAVGHGAFDGRVLPVVIDFDLLGERSNQTSKTTTAESLWWMMQPRDAASIPLRTPAGKTIGFDGAGSEEPMTFKTLAVACACRLVAILPAAILPAAILPAACEVAGRAGSTGEDSGEDSSEDADEAMGRGEEDDGDARMC